MKKKPSNVVRIGLIDMLSAFLVSSIVLMLIIAFNQPTAGNDAGYPKDFVRAEIMVVKDNLPEVSKGARFQFTISTPEREIVKNKIENSEYTYDKTREGNFQMVDSRNQKYNAIQLWGGSLKRKNNEIKTDTLYYVMYGVTNGKKEADWKIQVQYFDNELLSEINFEQNSKIDEYIKEAVWVGVRWNYLDGNHSSNAVALKLGESHEFEIKQ